MQIKKMLLFVFWMSILAGVSQAATIQGTIFDIDLDKVDTARVEIDTQPRQVQITQDGTYSFEVGTGTYTINAQVIDNGTVTAAARETVAVKRDGDYRLDLIVFPDLEVEDDLLNESEEIDIREAEDRDRFKLYATIIIGLLVFAAVVRHFINKHSSGDLNQTKKEESDSQDGGFDDDAQAILSYLDSEGGRASQKDIRKEFPDMSEAKVSLILTELEHKEEIEKIKKGRSNVVIRK